MLIGQTCYLSEKRVHSVTVHQKSLVYFQTDQKYGLIRFFTILISLDILIRLYA